MQKEVEKMSLSKYFNFLGWVPDVKDILNQTDIFIRPSITEGMPLTILEAMACQLPVIASNVSGVPELIDDHHTGLLIDVGDIKSLSQKIVLLSTNRDLRLTIGKKARSYIEKHFQWDITSEKTFDLYKKTLNEFNVSETN